MLLNQRDLAERFDRDVSTITRWRQDGLLPDPVSVGKKNYQWDEADIAAWERLGYANATSVEVERNLSALADDLDVIASAGQVHPALRKLAGTAATSLRVPGLDQKIRLALGGVYVVQDWFKDLDDDGPEVLRALRANLRILGIINAKN